MLNEDEEVWVVQGSKGRRPVSMPLGSTAEDAVIKYATKMTAT
jgi:hypothetical protein